MSDDDATAMVTKRTEWELRIRSDPGGPPTGVMDLAWAVGQLPSGAVFAGLRCLRDEPDGVYVLRFTMAEPPPA